MDGDKLSAEEINTLQNIIEAAKKEFLEKGFRGASLRNIVRTANVTTGAFYGYYKSKEELFDAIVETQADYITEMFINAHNNFVELPYDEQSENMGKISGKCMEDMLKYMYQYPEEFKLILCYSEGTKYENFVHKMVEVEIEETHKFADVLKSLGKNTRLLNPQLEHMLISGMLSAYFEMIIHDMPYPQAVQNLKDLRTFYTAGWKSIMDFD